MDRILRAREKIYDHLQDCSSCGWHKKATHDEFLTYCVAKDTIQDTAETLLVHREKGFVSDIYHRYFEFYGILQAIFMQQDAIAALHDLFMPTSFPRASFTHWNEIRQLRNKLVGHPVERRHFLSRNLFDYPDVTFSHWQAGNTLPTFEHVNLGSLIDAYADEAGVALEAISAELNTSCATRHA